MKSHIILPPVTMETMPKAIRSGRANGRQSEFLVDYMVSHSEFANGKLMGPQGAINATQHWADLSNRLNELGPEKTMEQWKKVWRDLKRNTRGRAAAINAAHRQTGNPDIEDKLSNLDRKVIAVIGWESSTGIPGLSAIGLLTDASCTANVISSNKSSNWVEDPKSHHTDNYLEIIVEDNIRPTYTSSTQNVSRENVAMLVPQPEQHQTTGPPYQTGPPHQTVPSHLAGPPHQTVPSHLAGPPHQTVPSNQTVPSHLAGPPHQTVPSHLAGPPHQTVPSHLAGPSNQTVPSHLAGPPHPTVPSHLAGPSNQTEPSNESAGSSHKPKSVTKRKRCDDYEERFLQKFSRVQEENASNARATNEHLKAVTDAFIKIAEATNALTIVAQVNSQSNERMASAIERMAASNETMAAAISQLAETIGKK